MADTKTVSLPPEVIAAAEVQARLSGRTLEQWISFAIADGLRSEEATQEFFRIKRERAVPGSLQRILDAVPNVPPMPGDKLE